VLARGLMVLALAGCLPPLSTAPTNVIDLRYRSAAPTADTTIRIYRWIGSRSSSVKSRCRMAPTDSEMFATRAQQCGGVTSVFWGVSRVLLEEARDPRFAVPLRLDGRLRWVDLPDRRCGR